MSEQKNTYQFTERDYRALVRKTNAIKKMLSLAWIKDPKLVRIIADMDAILARAVMMPGAPVATATVADDANTPMRTPADVTSADIEQAIGQPAENLVVYNHYTLADMDCGWNRDVYAGYKIGDQDMDAQMVGNMCNALSRHLNPSDVKLLTHVTMNVSGRDYPGKWKWTAHAPQYDPMGRNVVANVVLMTADGRIVSDKDAWFGVGNYVSADAAAILGAHEFAKDVYIYPSCRSALISGIKKTLSR